MSGEHHEHKFINVQRTWDQFETRTNRKNETTLWKRVCAEVQCYRCSEQSTICGEWRPA